MLAAASQIWAADTPLLNELRGERASERAEKQEMEARQREFDAKWKAMTAQKQVQYLIQQDEKNMEFITKTSRTRLYPEWQYALEQCKNALKRAQDEAEKEALEKARPQLIIAGIPLGGSKKPDFTLSRAAMEQQQVDCQTES